MCEIWSSVFDGTFGWNESRIISAGMSDIAADSMTTLQPQTKEITATSFKFRGRRRTIFGCQVFKHSSRRMTQCERMHI